MQSYKMLASFFADQLDLVAPSVLSRIKKGYHTSVPFFKDSTTNLSIGSKTKDLRTVRLAVVNIVIQQSI